jgi:hypothetical protein
MFLWEEGFARCLMSRWGKYAQITLLQWSNFFTVKLHGRYTHTQSRNSLETTQAVTLPRDWSRPNLGLRVRRSNH